MTSFLTTKNTTKLTVKKIATERTTTAAGTAEWKVQRMIPTLRKYRNRQVKNFLTVTMLSLGVPMILMGDEVRRTQGGNNNAYCHDNEGNWFDWSLVEQHADVRRFVKLLIARRLLRDTDAERQRKTLTQLISEGFKGWHGVKLHQPDWSDGSHSIAFSAELAREGLAVFAIFNAYWQPLEFELPPVHGAQERAVATVD